MTSPSMSIATAVVRIRSRLQGNGCAAIWKMLNQIEFGPHAADAYKDLREVTLPLCEHDVSLSQLLDDLAQAMAIAPMPLPTSPQTQPANAPVPLALRIIARDTSYQIIDELNLHSISPLDNSALRNILIEAVVRANAWASPQPQAPQSLASAPPPLPFRGGRTPAPAR